MCYSIPYLRLWPAYGLRFAEACFVDAVLFYAIQRSHYCRARFRSVVVIPLSFLVLVSGCATEPVTENLLAQNPISESPVTESPVSESPVSESPVSESPVSENRLISSDLIDHSMQNNQSILLELTDWHALELASLDKSEFTEPDLLANKLQKPPVAPSEITVQLVDAPVELVLHTLANDAQLQLQFNQVLSGKVTLLGNNQPIETLLDQLALQVPLFWKIDQGVLQLWGDKPYTESYAVDYLNIDRSTRSHVGLATQVGTINAGADGGGGGVANSSQTSLENSANHHFWGSLASDLDGLVNSVGSLNAASYTMNRDAGLITLNASAPLHGKLQRYLEKLNTNAQRQVLIEATVVEVALSNDFQAGIDWQVLSNEETGISAAQILSGSPQVNADTVGRVVAPSGLLSLVQRSNLASISATLNLLEQFGDVRILSKPRIIALNNQTSVLKVVDNRVYFTVNVERQRSENKDEVITETQIHTVPVGLVMNVTPYIDEGGEVMLNVRPTLSRILGFVNDPNPELATADVRNSVPEIQVREMESMLRVKSGEMAIIGGLMQDIQDGSDSALPGFASLPIVGALFRARQKIRRQSELLIVLKPTVLSPANSGSMALK